MVLRITLSRALRLMLSIIALAMMSGVAWTQVPVSDISAALSQPDGTAISVSGEVVVTVRTNGLNGDANRGQFFVMDASGDGATGLFIDDPDQLAGRSVVRGDVLTGLAGRLTTYRGIRELQLTGPFELVRSGEVVTATDLTGMVDFDAVAGELVRIDDITVTGSGFWSGNTNYTISGAPVGISTLRVEDASQIVGLSIPINSFSVIGIAYRFDDSLQVMPAEREDIIDETNPPVPINRIDAISRSISVFVSPAYEARQSDAVSRPFDVNVSSSFDGTGLDAIARPLGVIVAPTVDEGGIDAVARPFGIIVSPTNNVEQDAVSRSFGVYAQNAEALRLSDAVARAFDTQVTLATNDEFSSATLIVGELGSISGTTRGTSNEDGEPAHQQEQARYSVWYRFVVPADGAYRINSCNATFDTRLAVYRGTSLAALTAVASLDATGFCRARSGATFRAMAGEELYLAVDGYRAAWGEFTLAWERIPPPGNDNFEFAEVLEPEGSLTTNNSSATGQSGEPTHAGAAAKASLWWKWTPTVSGTYDFRTCGSAIDTVLAVYTGTQFGSLAAISSNDNCCDVQSALQFAATAGTDYYIAVDSKTTLLGALTLTWSRASSQQNDAFASARVIEGAEGVISGNHFAATVESGEPAHMAPAATRSLWYRWVAPRSGAFRLTVGGAPTIACYRGNSFASLTLVDALPDVVQFNAVKGTTYQIAVASRECAPTDFDLIWGYDSQPLLTVGLGTLETVEWSPGGDRFATGGGGGAFIWDAASGQVIRRMEGHSGDVTDLAFTADGQQLVTASTDRTVRIWDVQSALEISRLRHPESVLAVAVSPDQRRVLTGAADGIVRVWDLNGGFVIFSIGGHSGGASDVAYSPDGELALTASAGGTCYLWRADSGEAFRTLSGHTGAIRSARFSPDGGGILTSAADGEVRYWSAASGSLIRILVQGSLFSPQDAVFAPDGVSALVAYGDPGDGLDNPIDRLEIDTRRVLESYSRHRDDVVRLAYRPGTDRFLSASSDANLFEWSPEASAPTASYSGHTLVVSDVAFSGDNSLVYTRTSSGLLQAWALPTGAPLPTVPQPVPTLAPVSAATGQAIYVSAGGTGATKIYELRPPRAIVVAGGGDYPGNSIARQTHELGIYTYRTLLARGYTPESILYLSAFPEGTSFTTGGEPVSWDIDGDGTDDVDGLATREALLGALSGEFAAEAGRLLILLMNHGYKTKGFMAFRLNPTEALTTLEVNTALNALQSTAPVDVTLVVDSCYSGQFVLDCRKTGAIPSNRTRIVVASTTPTAEAVFLPAPDLTSFMYTFLGSAYMGNSMGEAFRSGSRLFGAFPVAGQQPMIDDGVVQASGPDVVTTRANREFFGASWAYGVQSDNNVNRFFPAFDSMEHSGTPNVPVGEPVAITIRLLPFQQPVRMKLVIRPPAATVLAGEPVTDLPFRILDTPTGGSVSEGLIYSYTFSPSDPNATFPFADEGAYRLTATAEFENFRVSDPEDLGLLISDDPDPDTTAIRAVLAFASADGVTGTALTTAGDFAYTSYTDKFQSADGTKHPEWIDFLTNNIGTIPTKSTRRHEETIAKAAAQRGTKIRSGLTKSALLSAIATRGSEAGRLYIHIAAPDASNAVLRIDGEQVSAVELDARLDALQPSASQREIIVVLDGAGSGSFLTPLRATGDQRRLIMTSSRAGDCAFFLADPPVTFTHKLVGPLWSGASYFESLTAARGFFTGFAGGAVGTTVVPQLDQEEMARHTWLGRRYAFAGDEAAGLPFLIQAEVVTDPDGRRRLRANLMKGIEPAIDLDGHRVYAQVNVEGVSCGLGSSGAPRIRLRRESPASWIWSAPVPSALIPPGQYPLVFLAEYNDDPATGRTRASSPVFRSLQQPAFPTGSEPDAYEVDDSPAEARRLYPGFSPQVRTIHELFNQDWIRLSLNGQSAVDGRAAVIPYTVHIGNLDVPPGTLLRASVYLDGIPDPLPAAGSCLESQFMLCEDLTGDSGEQQISVLTDGVQTRQEVYIRIELIGTPIDPNSPVGYTIHAVRSTGANNGIVASIGTVRTRGPQSDLVARLAIQTSESIQGQYEYADLKALIVQRIVPGISDDWETIGRIHLPKSECQSCPLPQSRCLILDDRSLPAGTQEAIYQVLAVIPTVGGGEEILTSTSFAYGDAYFTGEVFETSCAPLNPNEPPPTPVGPGLWLVR